jgi:hypothetical protein
VNHAALVTPWCLTEHAFGQENICIMYHQAWRFALLLSPLLAVAACASGGQHTTRLLNDRLQANLAPEIAAGNASLQALPDGARVTLLSTSSFPSDIQALESTAPDIRSNVIESLLDPSLMRVQVADSSALPDRLRQARVQNVDTYFVAYGLGSTLVEAGAQGSVPPGPAGGPTGVTIDIHVQCPAWNGRTGYGSGKSMPVCD